MTFGLFTLRQYIAQFQWLREQYLTHHLKVSLSGCALESAEGDVLGYVEEVNLSQNRLTLRGWARVQSATFRLGPTVRQVRPHLERLDVSAALGCDPHTGFSLSLPFFDDPLQIELVQEGGGRVVMTHPLPVAQGRQAAMRALKVQFWREIVPMLPMIAAGLRRADPDLRRRLKTALRLNQGKSVSLLDARFLSACGVAPSAALSSAALSSDQIPEQAVTIILPVFNAFALLPEVLSRVVAHTDLPWHLIVVEDKSTDPEVRPWLREWARAQPEGRVTLLENDVNQGFIRSVNHGFDAVLQAGGAGR
ncbi:MAG: glycosyltransferase family 2 protein [Rhodobacterales bacterium]